MENMNKVHRQRQRICQTSLVRQKVSVIRIEQTNLGGKVSAAETNMTEIDHKDIGSTNYYFMSCDK